MDNIQNNILEKQIMLDNKLPSFSVIEDFIKFMIVRKIAEGGMGAVYEALELGAEGFEKTVAIKTMLAKLTLKEYSELFIAEAKLVANLVHENIVQIYQLGRLPGGYYIVMEYVNGISLANFIASHKTMGVSIPENLAVFIASRIARGLAYAHKRKDEKGKQLHIVHRDVCPGNILITTEGLPKLADFGVAKVVDSVLCGDGFIVGKLFYMAPEQARKEHVDYRADIFSLGSVLFELLSCNRIRKIRKNTTVRHAKRMVKQPIPWDLLPKSTHKDLKMILKKMLALKPGDRYQDTDTLAHALEYFIYREGYGPTIQTLEHYMREHFSYLYMLNRQKGGEDVKTAETAVLASDFLNITQSLRNTKVR